MLLQKLLLSSNLSLRKQPVFCLHWFLVVRIWFSGKQQLLNNCSEEEIFNAYVMGSLKHRSLPLKVYPFFLILPCLTEEPSVRHTHTHTHTHTLAGYTPIWWKQLLQEEMHRERNLSLSGTTRHTHSKRQLFGTYSFTHNAACTQMHTHPGATHTAIHIHPQVNCFL